MKKGIRHAKYSEPLIACSFRIPLSVEAALAKAATLTGQTKVSLLLESLSGTLPAILSPIAKAV